MGLFSKAKPKAPARMEPDILASGTDGIYETDVRGEKPHRAHLVAALARRKRGPGWDVGRVPVPAFAIPLGYEQHNHFAVEIDGRRVGFIEDKWVKAWGETYTRAAAVVDSEVAYPCAAAICWKPSLGNPLKDESIPLGVRLDLADQAAIDAEMDALDDLG